MKKNVFIALLFIGGLASCSDDDDHAVDLESNNIFVCKSETGIPNIYEYPATHFSKTELKEVKEEPGAPDVTVTQIYDYSAGRLRNFTSSQSFRAGGESFQIENETNIVYGDHQAIVTDEINNVSTYTLNDNGYAISCIRREMDGKIRSYTFDYLINAEGKYFLKNITEMLDGDQPYSSIHIDYSSSRELHITQLVDIYEQSYTATTPVGEEIINASELPFMFLTELYPLNLHTAGIYGKLLGDSYNILIDQLKPDENSESKEVTTYLYAFNKQYIINSYREITKSYGKEYVRTVSYTIE